MLRIARDEIEIDEPVKYLRRADPLIQRRPRLLAFRPGTVEVAAIRHLRCDKNLDTAIVRLRSNLCESPFQLLHELVIGLMHARLRLDIVDSLKEDQITHATSVEHVPIDARHRVRPISVEKQTTAAGSHVDYAEHSRFLRRWILRKPHSEIVGPAPVAIKRGMIAVGDR